MRAIESLRRPLFFYEGTLFMLLSRISFCQFFSPSPRRRRMKPVAAAQLELLYPRILLSATSAESSVSGEPAAETTSSEESAPEASEPELNSSEDPGASTSEEIAPETSEPGMNDPDPSETETSDPGPDVTVAAPWLDYVEVMVVSGTTTMTGTIGDYDAALGLSLTLDGVFAGGSPSIQPDGSFEVFYGSELSGFGSVRLMDADGTELDFWELYA